MNAIKATWKDGRIVIDDAVDWPEGCEVLIEPVLPQSDRIGIDESEWRDDVGSLSDWDAWIAQLEPLEFTPDEESSLTEFEREMSHFNIEAVRRQMAGPQP